MKKNGPKFKETLKALRLDSDQERDAKRNAADIVTAIIKAYGATSGGNINPKRIPRPPVTGLVYGRIQSGKTRAMIASTAMAFDNKFRVAVVMTSNINDLVDQTLKDFTKGLPGLLIFTKDTDLDREVRTTKIHMEKGAGSLLLICSKGKKSLLNISKFLRSLGAKRYPGIIFDDEGDQASLDTNTAKRSRSRISVAPSAINNTIQNHLRKALPRHVYVSVTGTPQAVLLQSAESFHRPSFIRMLPAGAAYIGGDRFFGEEEPKDNPELISVVNADEKDLLLDVKGAIPDGLRRSIVFFLVSAAAAIANRGLEERGYSYLCHPSLRNDEQKIAVDRIGDFLDDVLNALHGAAGSRKILLELRAQYRVLRSTLHGKTPAFARIKAVLIQHIPRRKLLTINAKTKRQGIEYGNGLNFLIGGNVLGRGIAIADLLVTYYVRAAKVSQIDTMHQHARMYGYRKATIDYTRLFITKDLYYRFRDIHHSDEDLRAYIDKHKALPKTFPIEYQYNLRTTRSGVLDVKKTDTLSPGQHLYPNYIDLSRGAASYDKVLKLMRKRLGFKKTASIEVMNKRAPQNVVVTPAEAAALVKPIKTKSRNTWRDSTISNVIAKVAEKFGDKISLRFRTAKRTVGVNGFIATGTLFGGTLAAARRSARPTLWIMAATTTSDSASGKGKRFMYPTFVIPEKFPSLFMFNRGN